jgi:hypothetical protein
LRYCIFLGIYGIISAIINIVSLFVTAVSALVPLLMNIMGAMLFLAGGVAWAVNFRKIIFSCSEVIEALEFSGFSRSFAESTATSCRRCAVDEALVFTLFALSLSLAVCSLLHRRSLVQSAKF